METDLTQMCDDRVKKEKEEIETEKDAEILELTTACKSQCD